MPFVYVRHVLVVLVIHHSPFTKTIPFQLLRKENKTTITIQIFETSLLFLLFFFLNLLLLKVLIWLKSIGRSHCIAIAGSLSVSLSVCGSVFMGKSTACLGSAIVILCCCFSISHVTSDASDHRYKEGDSVPFYANKVGPFHNPRSDFHFHHFHVVCTHQNISIPMLLKRY